MKTETKKTWMNTNGMVVCERHAGNALAVAIESHPRRTTHETDLETWQVVTPAMVNAWAEMFRSASAAHEQAECEVCRHHARKDAAR